MQEAATALQGTHVKLCDLLAGQRLAALRRLLAARDDEVPAVGAGIGE